MSSDHPGVDHAVIDHAFHGARVRVVAKQEVEATVTAMRLLFPHDVVLKTSIGLNFMCVYTDNAPASLVADRVSAHLRETERRAA